MAIYEIDNLPAPVQFEGISGMVQRTLHNAKNLLMTRMGEVPYDRMRGFNPALFELPMKKFREALLPELDRLMRWEPDAEVAYANCDADKYGNVVIRVGIEMKIE